MNESTVQKLVDHSKYSIDLNRSARRLFTFLLGQARFKNTNNIRLDDGQAARQAGCHQSELSILQKRLVDAGMVTINQGRQGAAYTLWTTFENPKAIIRKTETVELVEPLCIV